jgi:hypothetical protein
VESVEGQPLGRNVVTYLLEQGHTTITSHSTSDTRYAEDPYSLSKWVLGQQVNAFVVSIGLDHLPEQFCRQ